MKRQIWVAGVLLLAGCAGSSTETQAVSDAQTLVTGLQAALAAAQASVVSPTPAQTAEFAQISADLGILQSAAEAISAATASSTTVGQIQSAVGDLAPVLEAVWPAGAPVIAAAEVLVPVLVQEITGGTVSGIAATGPNMSVGEARLVLKGQASKALGPISSFTSKLGI